MERVEGWVQLGNRTITVSGIVSSAATPVQRSYPSSTITVYLTGTLTLASIYSDNAGSAKANPFTADATGFYFFYVGDGAYDVKLSGDGLPAPFTLGPDTTFDQAISWINVKAAPYLAKGDGSTDDTAAIAAAITAGSSPPFRVFFPPGIYIVSQNGSDYILPQPSNEWIQGSGMDVTILRVKANSGSYKSFFGPYATLVNNFTLSDITIDQNSLNNVIPNIGDLNAHYRDIVSPTSGGGGMLIDNVEITNIAGINTFYFGTPYTTITNCRLTNVGGATNFDFDYSGIYSSGDNCVIANNIITARSLGANGARTAIETHSSDLAVTGNVMTNLVAGCIITSLQPSEGTAIAITGNTINGAFYGIALWSNQYAGHTTGNGLNGVVVSGNSIRLNQTAYLAMGHYNNPAGITVDPHSDLPIKNTMIIGNTVEYDLETIAYTTLDTSGCGIGYWDFLQTNSAHEFTIANNNVLNAPGHAIRCDVDCVNFVITGNSITNPGSSVGFVNVFSRVGIFVRNGTATVQKNILISNNNIQDAQATSKMVYGITIACPNNTAGGISCIGNMISATGATVTSVAGTHGIASGVVYINDYEWVPASSAILLPSGGVQIGESLITDTFRGLRYRYKAGTGWLSFWNFNDLTGTTTAGHIAATSNIHSDISMDAPNFSVRNPGSVGIVEWDANYTGSSYPARWKIGPGDAESTANAGSNLYVFRYADDGSFLASNVEFERDNGNVTLLGNLRVAALGGVNTTISLQGASGSAVIFVGTGSPNGVVTANVGSIYLNFSGGSATTLYVKESGNATNTGWIGK